MVLGKVLILAPSTLQPCGIIDVKFLSLWDPQIYKMSRFGDSSMTLLKAKKLRSRLHSYGCNANFALVTKDAEQVTMEGDNLNAEIRFPH